MEATFKMVIWSLALFGPLLGLALGVWIGRRDAQEARVAARSWGEWARSRISNMEHMLHTAAYAQVRSAEEEAGLGTLSAERASVSASSSVSRSMIPDWADAVSDRGDALGGDAPGAEPRAEHTPPLDYPKPRDNGGVLEDPDEAP